MGVAKVEVGNEFNIVHSDVFKALWPTLSDADKKEIKGQVLAFNYICSRIFLSNNS